MAESLDEQQQKKKLQDAALVPVKDQVHIPMSNLRIALERFNQICLIGKASGYDRPRLPMLQLLWGMATGNNVDFAELIWEEFKHQIETRRNHKQKQNYMPYP
ncbi:hypothetical protein Tco_0977510 [Tanacetum coccineum]|uniref:Uncharacterized protein n=1 Tax=Tanacetum coccineum TaxID=301880 RepID=A0ABQ5EKR9_9ASTR